MIEILNDIEVKESIVPKGINDFIDAIEDVMVNQMVASGEFERKEKEREPVHLFTPGLYSRELTLYPGDRITSKIHKFEHQFVISQGSVVIFDNGKQFVLNAPYRGVTKAGTRRVGMVREDATEPCVWTTFHPVSIMPENDSKEAINEAVDKIEELIIEKHENSLITGNNETITN